MRWKLIRRRLSISAPRVMVRRHLPWPFRWAVAALALGFSAAIALWAFEFGKGLAGVDRGSSAEVLQLRADLQRLREDGQRAQSVANTAESLLRAERAAQERLAQQVRQLEAERQALRDELGFFETLIPATRDEGIQLRGLQASHPGSGELRVQVLVMQGRKGAAEFEGGVELTLAGTLEGRPWSQSLAEGRKALRLRQYARVEASIEHPPQAVLKSLQVKVVDPTGAVRASQSLKLPQRGPE